MKFHKIIILKSCFCLQLGYFSVDHSQHLKLTFELETEPRQREADGGEKDVDEVVGGQRDHQLEEDWAAVLLSEKSWKIVFIVFAINKLG